MNLLIDIGNSNFKWSFSDGDTIDEIYGFKHSLNSLTSLLTSTLSHHEQFLNVENIYVCCVAGSELKSIFSEWLFAYLSKTAFFFESTNSAYGVQNAYDKASDLGNDRWLSLVYIHHLYNSNACIIDCGTAITIDVILKNGEHMGGLIAPGYASQISALTLKTNISTQNYFINQGNSILLQNNTHQCIEQGCRNMSIAFIKEVVTQLKQQFGDTLEVVVTGGDSESFALELPQQWHFRSDLLFHGLRFISKQKSESKTI